MIVVQYTLSPTLTKSTSRTASQPPLIPRDQLALTTWYKIRCSILQVIPRPDRSFHFGMMGQVSQSGGWQLGHRITANSSVIDLGPLLLLACGSCSAIEPSNLSRNGFQPAE